MTALLITINATFRHFSLHSLPLLIGHTDKFFLDNRIIG